MLDEHEPAKPTPLPNPNAAYTEGQKAAILGRVLAAWCALPGMRLGQLLYAACLSEDEHVSQVTDVGLATAVESWTEDYR